ncbi:hypothetical protein COY32_00085 [candidate division WWE3 bacterium CG_4_10_14_0_2_um_filter_41_14]|uniref:Isoprenylcysteine carboxylmethyltransferase family protein n=1 Tax=candidate division WWE3 bacterium CG_4_10_14_0_2_um_filter_41_14 TaxID=1975072 RepID=A0A2M7TM69_UNCKA|nr:MAG: hypothetical protein COY32_00085 [candidate division WWE3 bacterium CG_4_10_14_0_2_um_filter_41_14]
MYVVKPREIILKVTQQFAGYVWYGASYILIVPYLIVRLSEGLDYLIFQILGFSSQENFFSFVPFTILSLIAFVVIAFGFLIILESTVSIATESKGFAFSVSPHYHVNPQKLATAGWYARVRHPMTLGYLIILMGLGIYLQSISMIVWFVPLFGGLYLEYLLMVEEKQLHRWFGSAYEEYQKKVPALIPRIL